MGDPSGWGYHAGLCLPLNPNNEHIVNVKFRFHERMAIRCFAESS